MKKLLILMLIVLSSCGGNVVGNSIVIGSVRANFLSVSPKIYAIDEKGVKRSISVPISDASNVQWSPDRQWIVYETEDTISQIMLVKSDGTERFQLTNATYTRGGDPAWSPNGYQIAGYLEEDNGQYGIYVIDVSCIMKKQKCELNYQFVLESGSMPSWSPDGKQLAFWTSDHQIFVVSIEAPQKTKRITPEDIECFEMAWSPVGDEIAIRCFVSHQGNNIFLVNSDGSNFRNITNSKSQDGFPTWSPDGTKIAFVSNRDSDLGKSIGGPGREVSSNAVYIMNNDGSDVKRISPYGNERIVWLDWLNP